MGTNTELYDQDFYTWCLTTAGLIRDGKWQDLDPEALAEEIESLGRSEHRELEHRLEVLVMQLLKWRYQPERREDSHSWYDTILDQRSQLARLLRDNPSLRPHVPTFLTEGYTDCPPARDRRDAPAGGRLSPDLPMDACRGPRCGLLASRPAKPACGLGGGPVDPQE